MARRRERSNRRAALASERQRERQRARGGGQGGLIFPPVHPSSPSSDGVAGLGPFVASCSVIFAERCEYFYRLFLSVSHSNGLW